MYFGFASCQSEIPGGVLIIPCKMGMQHLFEVYHEQEWLVKNHGWNCPSTTRKSSFEPFNLSTGSQNTHTHSECCGKVIVFPMMFFAPRQDHQCQSVEPRTGRGARKRGSATCDVPFMARLSQGSPSAGRSWAWRFGVLDGTLAAATRAPEMPTMTCRTLGMARHSSRWVTTLEPFRGIEPCVILDSIFDGIYSSCQLTWDSLWCSL